MLPAYVERNRLLKELGYESYRAYLSSPLWRGIRERALERDGHKCFGCRRLAKQVHHTKYTADVLLGVDIDSLRSICGGCHRTIEFWFGDKQTLNEANKSLRRKRKRNTRRLLNSQCPIYNRLYTEKKAELRRLRQDKTRPRDRLREITRLLRAMVKSGSVSPPTYLADAAALFVGDHSTSR